ncbi:hypothetical protein BDF22DRAFT_668187 [Syncephalis plumigaleata]|nr:hypothetical protein BDF22DRAFT_668187 [Syncephalis plumigaleata]
MPLIRKKNAQKHETITDSNSDSRPRRLIRRATTTTAASEDVERNQRIRPVLRKSKTEQEPAAESGQVLTAKRSRLRFPSISGKQFYGKLQSLRFRSFSVSSSSSSSKQQSVEKERMLHDQRQGDNPFGDAYAESDADAGDADDNNDKDLPSRSHYECAICFDLVATNASLSTVRRKSTKHIIKDDTVKAALLLSCGHAYCHECIKRYVELYVKRGGYTTTLLHCPIPKCTHEITTNTEDVARIIDPHLLAQWRGETEAKPTMTRTILCPNKTCRATLMPTASQSFSWDSSIFCSQCGFKFCVKCTTANHIGFPCSNLNTNSNTNSNQWSVARRQSEPISAPSKQLAVRSKSEAVERSGCHRCQGCNTMISGHKTDRSSTNCLCSHEFCYRCGGKWDTTTSKCLLSGCTLNDSIHWPEEEGDQVEEAVDELMTYDISQLTSTKRKSWQRSRWSMPRIIPNMSGMRRIITRSVSSRRHSHMVLP